ncbi:aldehyde oxidase GLOX1-like [Sesamum indicum]|uniref:Aldehyde oxidase GLOX1-like n=1 Tax=Sesamum indicum TaxID=4182 RepID=A0A6I9TCJ7_SESIN|nr:aldehyde oxidase GLOX1-like [Sesamum indicum]
MKISSTTNLLKSLVVLSLLFYYATADEVSPHTVSRYRRNNPKHRSENNGHEPGATKTRGSKAKKGLFGGMGLGFLFGNDRQQTMEGSDEELDTSDIASTEYRGSWKIDSENAGVSAMHVQLMPNNKAVWFDSTSNGLSEIQNNPPFCKPRFGGRQTDPPQDCTAHGVEYDIETGQVRPLKVGSSPWCSSGGLGQKGNLVSTGGDKDGFKAVRNLNLCPNCDFEENPRALFANRWYATQHTLEDGSFIVVGGRNAFNYEIIPSDSLQFTPRMTELALLEDTTDDGGRENNLYPFVNLLPDGNLFVFANYKSIVLNPNTGETIRNLPDLPGGSRNYPASGMSALLPINLDIDENSVPKIEVLICGGNTHEAYTFSDLQQPKRTFLPALRDCGKLNLNEENAKWEIEQMPSRRVMGDMLLLPTGDVLMINGAQAGTSAWNSADIPNLTPVLYSPNKKRGERFQELNPTTIPRMYHSVSVVLPNGQILVAGSNTNAFYMLEKYNDDFRFPTELRVEKFSPPYLDPALEKYRLEILEEESDKQLKYGGEFNVAIGQTEENVKQSNIKVTMYSPPFTTHGYSMNQRLLVLKMKEVAKGHISVVAPPSGTLAPPGHYLLFVVHHGVPSHGMWVHIAQ